MKSQYKIQAGIFLALLLAAMFSNVQETCAQSPTLTATVISYQQINLAWQSPFPTQASVVYRKEDNFGQQFTMVAQLGKSVLSYEDKTVEASKTYVYYVRIVPTTKDDDSYTNQVTVTTPNAPPAAPGNLAATARDKNSINLTWVGNNGAGTSFIIERSANGSDNFSVIATVPYSRDLSYLDTGLSPSTQYCYRIKATNSGGQSGYSSGACATTPMGSPDAPASLIARSLDPTFQIQLNWIDGSSNETGFEIERSTDQNNYTKIAATEANVTQYVNSDLAAETHYYYRVRAINTAGASSYTNIADAVTNSNPPAAPGNLTATTASATRIDLVWRDNSGNETGFEMERSEDGTNFSKIEDITANSTTYQSNGLKPNTQYWYRLRAKNNGGISAFSNIAGATTLDVAPGVPQNLTAKPISNTQINLGWDDISGNETGFEVERSTDGSSFSKIADLDANVTTFQNAGLTTLTRYWYRVRAKNKIGNSDYSNVTDVTTFDVPPVAPSGLTAKMISSSQIDLAWKDNAANETSFEIERSTDGTAYEKIDQVGSNVTTYQNTGLSPATRYWYRVRATNSANPSAYSNVADATTRDVLPNTPEALTASVVSFQQINLSWTDKSGNESGFDIEQSQDGTNFSKIGSVAANVTKYEITGLSQLTKYYFRVKATNAIGSSAYTNIADGTTLKAPIPDKPKNLMAIPIDFDLVQLTWDAVSTNAAEVVVERSNKPDADFVQIGKQAASITRFADREILEVQDYYYRIKAINAAGGSAYSDLAIVKAASIITGTEPVQKTNQLYAYDQVLHIERMKPGTATAKVFNSNGSLIKEFAVQQISHADLKELPVGIYIVVLEEKSQITKQKIVIYPSQN